MTWELELHRPTQLLCSSKCLIENENIEKAHSFLRLNTQKFVVTEWL